MYSLPFARQKQQTTMFVCVVFSSFQVQVFKISFDKIRCEQHHITLYSSCCDCPTTNKKTIDLSIDLANEKTSIDLNSLDHFISKGLR